MVRVLVVDDSALTREILSKGLSSQHGIEVVGKAGNAYEARDQIVKLRPDVMTLDIQMPGLNGIDFLRKLIPQYPIPVVMVSSLAESNAVLTLEALEAGAVDFVLKPSSRYNFSPEEMIKELSRKVLMAAQVDLTSIGIRRKKSSHVNISSSNGRYNLKSVIALGASTGGTEALRSIIRDLPPNIPGVVVVQHMPAVFTKMFADGLNKQAKVNVKEAEEGDEVLPGRVLIAPGGIHLELKKVNGVCRVFLKDYEKVNGHKPSIDVFFRSVAENCCPASVGVVLTGMGSDGAEGLVQMRQKGARTFAQDEKTSVVFGMPKEAYLKGGAERYVPLNKMVPAILGMLGGVK